MGSPIIYVGCLGRFGVIINQHFSESRTVSLTPHPSRQIRPSHWHAAKLTFPTAPKTLAARREPRPQHGVDGNVRCRARERQRQAHVRISVRREGHQPICLHAIDAAALSTLGAPAARVAHGRLQHRIFWRVQGVDVSAGTPLLHTQQWLGHVGTKMAECICLEMHLPQTGANPGLSPECLNKNKRGNIYNIFFVEISI